MTRNTQRAQMRALYEQSGFDEERSVAAYATMERRGEVKRQSNINRLSPSAYAAALLADGLRKGWL